MLSLVEAASASKSAHDTSRKELKSMRTVLAEASPRSESVRISLAQGRRSPKAYLLHLLNLLPLAIDPAPTNPPPIDVSAILRLKLFLSNSANAASCLARSSSIDGNPSSKLVWGSKSSSGGALGRKPPVSRHCSM